MNRNLKFFALVPSKLNSVRLREKNIQDLGGKPLLNYVIKTLDQVNDVEKIVLQSSSDHVLKFVEDKLTKIEFQKRPIELDSDSTSAQDFIKYFCKNYECDYVILLHITSPFITKETIQSCIDVIKEGAFDSSFAAIQHQNFAWYKNSPLNYDPLKPIPRTQDLEPIILEQTGFYIFGREFFLNHGKRIGRKPFIKFLEFPENLDIDTLEDLNLARFVLRSGLYVN